MSSRAYHLDKFESSFRTLYRFTVFLGMREMILNMLTNNACSITEIRSGIWSSPWRVASHLPPLLTPLQPLHPRALSHPSASSSPSPSPSHLPPNSQSVCMPLSMPPRVCLSVSLSVLLSLTFFQALLAYDQVCFSFCFSLYFLLPALFPQTIPNQVENKTNLMFLKTHQSLTSLISLLKVTVSIKIHVEKKKRLNSFLLIVSHKMEGVRKDLEIFFLGLGMNSWMGSDDAHHVSQRRPLPLETLEVTLSLRSDGVCHRCSPLTSQGPPCLQGAHTHLCSRTLPVGVFIKVTELICGNNISFGMKRPRFITHALTLTVWLLSYHLIFFLPILYM